MRKGEKALIRCTSKYAYGPIGRKGVGWGGTVEIPPDAGLEYEAEVKEVYPQLSIKDAPAVARVFEANLKKQHGNRFFHHQEWSRSIRCYQSALKSLDPGEAEEGEEGFKDVIKMYCDISNNLAATLLKMGMPKEAQEACIKVIELDKDNVKALYRGGMAAMALHNFEEAEIALKEAYKLAPKDVAIVKGIQELNTRRANYHKKEAAMMKQMSGFLLSKKATTTSNTEGEAEAKEGSGTSSSEGATKQVEEKESPVVVEEESGGEEQGVDAAPQEETQSWHQKDKEKTKPSSSSSTSPSKGKKKKTTKNKDGGDADTTATPSSPPPKREAVSIEAPPAKEWSTSLLGWGIVAFGFILPVIFFWDKISVIVNGTSSSNSTEAQDSQGGGEL